MCVILHSDYYTGLLSMLHMCFLRKVVNHINQPTFIPPNKIVHTDTNTYKLHVPAIFSGYNTIQLMYLHCYLQGYILQENACA